ncbi:MAG TPA: YdcF family protein, partial [Longimicrobium sp.]|nr:YdcF family protein [Longimicrobium sp.]
MATSFTEGEGTGKTTERAPRRRRARGCLTALGGTIAAVALLWLLRAPLLRGVAGWLSVEDPLRRGDVIYVLGGDPEGRPAAAAALYRQGIAPRVAVPRVEPTSAVWSGLMPSLTDVNRGVLRRDGVPDSAIVLLERPGGAASTADDAALVAGYVRRTGARTVVAVTSVWHTRRARWHLRRALEGTGATLV